MTISPFEALGVRFKLSSEEEIANISAPGPQIKKSKDTLLSQTLKVKEKTFTFTFTFIVKKTIIVRFLNF